MNSNKNTVPHIAEKILRRILPQVEREGILGDFGEIYDIKSKEKGIFRAKMWYLGQAVKFLAALIKRIIFGNILMVRSYVKLALRNLKRNIVYSLINVSGLTIGITCCLLILVFIADELTYDNYAEDGDRIYRVGLVRTYPTDVRSWSTAVPAMGPTLVKDYPEVLEASRLYSISSLIQQDMTVTYNGKSFFERRVIFADPNFFDFFDLKLLTGDPRTVLEGPGSLVLSASTAQKYFGDEEPIGKSIGIFYGPREIIFTVTGIAEDMPANAHFHFDFLPSFESVAYSRVTTWTRSWGVHTYIKLREDASAEQLERKLPDMVDRYVAPGIAEEGLSYDEFIKAGNGFRFFLQPFTDIHLNSHHGLELEPNGDVRYIYLFGAISMIILLIACINFMNLSTAKASNRATEVGVRKALGAFRSQLINQFFIETFLIVAFSMFASAILVTISIPVLNDLTGKMMDVNYFDNPIIIPALVSFAFGICFFAGSYPALFLSAFKPILALKGAFSSRNSTTVIRNGLVIFQFAVSAILIIGTLVVHNQMKFIQTKNLGFDKERVLIITNGGKLGSERFTLKQELLQSSSVSSVTFTADGPGKKIFQSTFMRENSPTQDVYTIFMMGAGNDAAETLGLKLVAGTPFTMDVYDRADTRILINETAAKILGVTEKDLGSRIRSTSSNRDIFSIQGIVKDFHFESLHLDVQPMMVYQTNAHDAIYIKMTAGNIRSAIDHIRVQWETLFPGEPFTLSFLEDDINALYTSEQSVAELFGIFSSLAIFLACIGLFGLSAFMAEQRTKEVGVRKVLGASLGSVILLISRNFIKLILISFGIAGPIAYYGMSGWLQGFAYRIDMEIGMFILAGTAIMAIALLTVSFQAIKAGRTNPVNSLRHE